jgi:cyclase
MSHFSIRNLIAICVVLLLSQRAVAVQSTNVEVLEVRPSFFMVAGAGANIGVQVGEDGIVVVDPGSAAAAPSVLAAIKRISAKQIRYIIDTGPDADHVGGNEALSKAGEKFFASATLGGGGLDSVAPIVAVETILRRMTAFPTGAQPTDVFHYARQNLYLNGEAVEVLRQPAAHTDSDAVVFFRRSDVVVAGDVLDTRHFPVIDVDRGGSIQGEIAALNRIVDLAVPSVPLVSHEGGTIVIPGHGRLCEQYDVVEYRDMVTIIRDRVRDLMKAGRSLAEVQAAQPAKGYTGRYGNAGGDWTADRFVEAIYRSLAKEKS